MNTIVRSSIISAKILSLCNVNTNSLVYILKNVYNGVPLYLIIGINPKYCPFNKVSFIAANQIGIFVFSFEDK